MDYIQWSFRRGQPLWVNTNKRGSKHKMKYVYPHIFTDKQILLIISWFSLVYWDFPTSHVIIIFFLIQRLERRDKTNVLASLYNYRIILIQYDLATLSHQYWTFLKHLSYRTLLASIFYLLKQSFCGGCDIPKPIHIFN